MLIKLLLPKIARRPIHVKIYRSVVNQTGEGVKGELRGVLRSYVTIA